LATLKGHTGDVLCLAFAPDGKALASGSGVMTRLRLSPEAIPESKWQPKSKKQDPFLRVLRSPREGAEKAEKAVHVSGEVKLWDVTTGQVRATLRPHAGRVSCVAFTPDGKTLASGSGVLNPNTGEYVSGEVRLWCALTGEERATLRGHAGLVHCVMFTADSKT